MASSILFLAWVPVAVEFVGLLALARRLGLLHKKPEPVEKGERPGEVSSAAEGGMH